MRVEQYRRGDLMSNALYAKGRQGFLDGQIDYSNDDIRVQLVKSTYTVNLTTHQYLSDIASGDRVALSWPLANKTSTGGSAGADPAVFTAVLAAAGAGAFAVVLQNTGDAATSRLIAYLDTLTGLPVTANGGDIKITWNGGVVFVL